MHKRLQNLERLCKKLQFRYGEDDELVVQLKHELLSLQTTKLKHPAGKRHSRRKQDKDASLGTKQPFAHHH